MMLYGEKKIKKLKTKTLVWAMHFTMHVSNQNCKNMYTYVIKTI